MNTRVKAIEMFSGAGGLALGLEAAGFETIAFYERDRDACQTLRHNRPEWNVVEADVCSVDFAANGPVDLVAGGPPCQPFSMGGKARGFTDHRDMFPQAVRAVRELRPRAFIFENVRGLLRPAFANYVEFIRLQLTYPTFPVSANVDWETNLRRLERHHTSNGRADELTYQVTINLADAADFGVPQRRHRVFFVGFRSDVRGRWSFPKPSHARKELLRAKFVTGEYWSDHGIPMPKGEGSAVGPTTLKELGGAELISSLARWQTVRDAIRGLGEPSPTSSWLGHRRQNGAKAYPGHTGSPLDDPSKALKAGDHGVPGGENMLRLPDDSVRYFSVREAARVQTFPDAWDFPSSWTESMRQLGNAVPVRLAQTVAASVAARLQPHASTRRIQSSR